ncbi:MAG: kelch repeat-containing protein [Bacteroidota bacterium]
MRKILFIAVSLSLLIGCSKNEPVALKELQPNRAPQNFELISPAIDAETDIIDITFEWEEAIDPDGDAVTYELYIYTDGESPVRIAENLTTTSYVLESKSPFDTSYKWYVVARDSGEESQITVSVERDFTTRDIQTELVLDSGTPTSFPYRRAYTGLYFNNTFFITNGVWESAMGDIWSSDNYGQSWSFERDLIDEGFSRYAHTSVIFDDRIYFMGGYQNASPLQEIYTSSDGTNWDEVNMYGLFSPRYEHSSVVFNNKIWVIGGYNDTILLDDVMSWTGTPEDRWELEAESAQTPFNGIRGHSSVVFDNRIWVIGGTDQNGHSNAVWVSDDGVNWTSSQNLPIATTYHKSVVFDNKIWVIGGLTASGPSTEIFYYDPETGLWDRYQAPDGVEITPSYNHAVVVVNDESPNDGIYIFGGFNGSEYFNNIWKLY